MKILNSRAAVYVQLPLRSIAEFSVRRRAVTLLRESEYLLRATAITYTQWENGEVVLFLYHSLLFLLQWVIQAQHFSASLLFQILHLQRI